MAHEFKIMNQSGTITTYTSYDDIPNDSTLKHVISFLPDLGTEIAANEMLLESSTLSGGDRIIPEDWSSGSENHLVLETASTLGGTNHYHEPSNVHHTDADGHTEDEHREIALWNYRLQKLITTENTNASSV